MAVLTLPRVSNEQPLDSGVIDWSNPITRGLVDALVPFSKRTVRGVPAASLGLSNEAAYAGLARKSGIGVQPDTYQSLGVGLQAPLTHLEFAERLDNSNNRSSGTFVVGTAGFGFLENTAIRACVVSSGGTITVISGTAANLLGTHCVVHVVRPTTQSLYDNGRLLTTAAHSGYAPASTAYHVGAPPNEPNISNRKRHFLNAVWSRELSPAEIASLNDNPWQIFAPARRRLIMGEVPATAVGATFSANAIAAANATAALLNRITFAGNAQGVATALGTLTLPPSVLEAFARGVATANARLSTEILLAASGIALSSASAQLYDGSAYFDSTYPLVGRNQNYPLEGEFQTYPLSGL